MGTEPAHHVCQLVRPRRGKRPRVSDDFDFFGVVARQRACRSFSTEAVDDETIARVLTAATFAPSAENKQPWEFVVVRDDATRAAIGDLSRRAWEARGRVFSERRLTP